MGAQRGIQVNTANLSILCLQGGRLYFLGKNMAPALGEASELLCEKGRDEEEGVKM